MAPEAEHSTTVAVENEEPAIEIQEHTVEEAAVGEETGPSAEPEPVVEQSMLEALHCALTLAQNNEAGEAADLLRCECSQAPASELGSAYQAVIEAYLRLEQLEPAFLLLSELLQSTSSSGRSIVPATCQELVLLALVQTQQHGRASDLLRSMCASEAAPSDAVFNSVVDAAVRARAYGEAWDVLELLLNHRRRADKYFVSILTKSLESSSDRKWVRRGITLVDRFIEQQKEDVDEIVFNSLLNVLGHVGDMLKLQQTLNRMTEYNVPPSAVTYGTVVKAYGRARDIDAVLKVWHDMRNRCLGVNPVTCGCVLDACVKCGHLDKAMAIFQEMRLQGLHKNTVLYATLIKGLAKVRDLMGAMHLYQEMRMEGVPCNLVTFNSLMDVCVRCGNLPMAAIFLQDMISMGINPDLITFSTLIKGYAHTGEVHKALALSKELKSRGLKCDEIMYNSLIDGCAKANKMQEGLMVFDDMLQSRVAPSNITFSILVKLYFEAGQTDGAFKLVDEMAGRYRCVPSRIVYTVLLRCCSQQGGQSLRRGVALLTELASKRNSKLPDQGMVSAVISGCIQHLEFELACLVVREFAAGTNAKRGSSGLVPLDALRSLMEALGAYDEPRGQELLEFLKRRSLPSSHTNQLQAAIADGRRQASNGQLTTAANAGAGNCMAPGNSQADTYAQWQNTSAYAPQSYGADYYQQYNGYQQQIAQMGQMGYYAAYQQPAYQQPQMPAMQMPMMPQAIQQMPVMPHNVMPMQQAQVPIFTAAGVMPEAPAPPVPEAQALGTVLPGLLPSAPVPPLPGSAAPAPTPAPQQAAPERKANRRAAAADKENACDKENAAPQQRSKGAIDVQKQRNNILEAANQRQAI
jgi:pentatricopeptide repeat protein